jgi:hypothetical protein
MSAANGPRIHFQRNMVKPGCAQRENLALFVRSAKPGFRAGREANRADLPQRIQLE